MRIKETINNFLKQNYIWLIFLFVLFLLFIRSYNFNWLFWFIDFGFSFLDIKQSILNNLFIWWEKRSFWENHFNFIFDIFEYLLYAFLIILWFPENVTPWILQLVTILLIPILFFINIRFISEIIYKEKLNQNYYWIFAFIPVFTLGFFNEQWHILFSQRYAWIISLILFYFLNKFIYLEKWKIWLLIASLFSIFAFNLFPFFLAFHIFIFFYIIYQILIRKISIKKVIILYLFYWLITFFAWFNILYLYWTLDFSNTDAVKYWSDLKTYVSSNNHLDNLFKWIFQVIWWSTLWWDSLTQTFPYQLYFKNWFYSFFLFFPIIIFLILLFISKFKNKINKSLPYLFILFFLLAIFISKWNNEPFWNIFIDLLNKYELLNIYRSPANKLMPIFFTFFTFSLFIFFIFIKNNYKKYFWILFILYYIIFLIPIFITWFYSKYSFFDLPNDYKNFKEYLNDYEWRVLILPERDYWKKYNFWAYVNSINYFNIKNSTFDIWQTLLSNNNVWLSKNLLNTVNFFNINDNNFNSGDIYQRWYQINNEIEIDIKLANQKLEESKIDFIIYDNNLIWTFNEKNISEKEKSYYNYLLKNITDFKYEKSIWNLDIYKKIWKLNWNNIFNFDKKFNFFKISPVKYNLIFFNILDKNNFYSNNSFDKWWKLYLKNQQGLFKKPLFEDTHHLVYDYANWWTISKDEIIKYVDENYSKELKKEGYPKTLDNWQIDYKYYKLNPDGSIDVELTLYFKPQSYFYLWLIISGTTFVLLIWYLWVDTIRNRRKKKEYIIEK